MSHLSQARAFESFESALTRPSQAGSSDSIHSPNSSAFLGICRSASPSGKAHPDPTGVVLDTTAFECVLGMDFLNHPLVNGLLLKPARLVVDNEPIPLLNTIFRIFNTKRHELSKDIKMFEPCRRFAFLQIFSSRFYYIYTYNFPA